MRAALVLALLVGSSLAAGLVPVPQDANGDLVPDTWAWTLDGLWICGLSGCAAGGASFEVVPGQGGNPQLHRHGGFAEVGAGDCAAACLSARQETFYHQPAGATPDITLHHLPDGGATGTTSLRAAGAWADVPTRVSDTDFNNNTHASASAPHGAGPAAGEVGVASAVLVLLHHDRGLPHTRLAYVAPSAQECVAGAGCAGVLLNQSYYHHDSDDDVVHEQHRVGGDHGLAVGCGAGCAPSADVDHGGGFLLEDSFFIIEPPSGVSGDGAAALGATPPLVAVPPARAGASLAFAARDPDRDLDVDEAFAEACALDRCVRSP